jgi:hypothetical protein
MQVMGHLPVLKADTGVAGQGGINVGRLGLPGPKTGTHPGSRLCAQPFGVCGIGLEVLAQHPRTQVRFLAQVFDQGQLQLLVGAKDLLGALELVFVDARLAGLEQGAQAPSQRLSEALVQLLLQSPLPQERA